MQAPPSTGTPVPWIRRVAGVYRTLAVVGFNTVVLLFLLNFAAYLLLGPPAPGDSPKLDGLRVVKMYGMDRLKEVYPHRTEDAIRQLLFETWSRALTYEPFTEFKEAAFSGKYVNVGNEGYRHVKDQAQWPPQRTNFNIFVFGGSTIFGYGVADDETIPSRLQEALRREPRFARICVYNFGRAFDYSIPERILFEKLIIAGFRQDLAVFVDGLNEFNQVHTETKLSPNIDRALHSMQVRPPDDWSQHIPLVRLLREKAGNPYPIHSTADSLRIRRSFEVPPARGNAQLAHRLGERYRDNQEIIRGLAGRLGIRVAFVWQPVAAYHADPARHPLGLANSDELVKLGYLAMDKALPAEHRPKDFLWAAGLHDGQRLPLYVDGVHYSAAFCEGIANFVADALRSRGLLAAVSDPVP